ncbi:MAG: TlpA disulfide reductase family protein [Deltaproteobacteria bacterium]
MGAFTSHYIEAHDFEGEMASGKKASLADFSGKFLILNFWATWCSPCLKEMPDLDQVYQSLGPENLLVLAVSMGESRERVRKFLKKRNYSYPSYMIWGKCPFVHPGFSVISLAYLF